ncbi:MAG: ATPase, T2SS/T4P/T4SS family [Pseudomonadota bacterium]|jgi:type II secretory ATPase GspE/PulE/Tfp pilus assembly ATPase PilB-like protein|nr:ATPase, T2SS/T4P/T4SS family [Pseudomonadota bacterium]
MAAVIEHEVVLSIHSEEWIRSKLSTYLDPEYANLCHVALAERLLYAPKRLHISKGSFIESAAKVCGLAVRYCEPEELLALRGNGRVVNVKVEATKGREADARGFAQRILRAAASYQASDVHLHRATEDRYSTIEFSVDDRVYVVDDSVTHLEMDALMGAYVQGLASAGGTRLVDGEMQHSVIGADRLKFADGIESVRVARGPCYPKSGGGKFMTLRLQYRDGPARGSAVDHLGMRLRLPPKPSGGLGFAALGYFPDQIVEIERALQLDTGIIVMAGPTGSGKSTALWEMLVALRKRWPYRRVVTAENPPEREIQGAVQLEIGGDEVEVTAQSKAFGEALRMMLRMAPNVILVGEIREGPIGRLAIEISNSGHLVMTTIHANNAAMIVPRLETTRGFELERGAYCTPDVLRMLVAQRLAPRVCPGCSVSYENAKSRQGADAAMAALRSYSEDLSRVRFEGPGCDMCAETGTAGKIAVAEVVPVTEEISDKLRGGVDDDAELKALMGTAAGGFMHHRAIALALRGVTDPLAMQTKVGWVGECRSDAEREWVTRSLKYIDSGEQPI